MAYFSNSTEGDMYEEKYCHNCINYKEDSGFSSCPILELHAKFNYEQHEKAYSKKLKKEVQTAKGILLEYILEQLIPTKPDKTFADECSMYTPRDILIENDEAKKAEYLKLLQEGKAPVFGV